jgi:CheY-like chemotaxis protein
MTKRKRQALILLIEDDFADATFVRRALADCAIKCDLLMVEDGLKALKFIEKLEINSSMMAPDVILLDVHLPYYDGLEILKKVRASERCGRTPVILMSGSKRAGETFRKAKKHAPHIFFEKRADNAAAMELTGAVNDLLHVSVSKYSATQKV